MIGCFFSAVTFHKDELVHMVTVRCPLERHNRFVFPLRFGHWPATQLTNSAGTRSLLALANVFLRLWQRLG